MTHVYFDSDQLDWGPYIHSQQIGQGTMMGGRTELDQDRGEMLFSGQKFMRGYGGRAILSSIGRFLLPIAKNLMESTGREAQEALGRIGADVTSGSKPLHESIRKQTFTGLQNIGSRLQQQCGKGRRKKRPRRLSPYYPAAAAAAANGEQQSEPLTTGPEPAVATVQNRKKMKNIKMPNKKGRDYLDF